MTSSCTCFSLLHQLLYCHREKKETYKKKKEHFVKGFYCFFSVSIAEKAVVAYYTCILRYPCSYCHPHLYNRKIHTNHQYHYASKEQTILKRSSIRFMRFSYMPEFIALKATAKVSLNSARQQLDLMGHMRQVTA